MEKTDFFVPSQYAQYELVEKKSRFIGQIWQVHSEAEAKEKIQGVKKQYHDGRHHCFAYILDDQLLRYSDDGEPQGTAGQPMLNLFQKEKIQQFCCVITRYFGGTLLGTGGLVRAYSHCAKGCLDSAGLSTYEILSEFQVITPYPQLEIVQKVMGNWNAVEVALDYGVDVTLQIRVVEAELFQKELIDQTSGKILVEFVGKVAELVPLLEKKE
ncbi:MAG: YigZ family protein [Eubacteriales bacterium]